MQSFLEEVVAAVWKKQGTLEETIFILPSKRAGTFLRNAIAHITQKTLFAPDIYSIESFVEHLSGLSYANNTQQLFELYSTYANQTPDKKDDFFTFSKWGQTLLQDFNEVDRYLVDTEKLFSNLYDIQQISHWSPDAPKTKMMEDYQQFWKNLNPLYKAFNNNLLKKGLGHQGLVYRQAVKKLEDYIASNKNKTYIFVGFNALNTAEITIIQKILAQCKSDIYWDLDNYFLDDSAHDASFFIRQHQRTWPQLQNHGLLGISDHFLGDKNIHIIGVPKNVSQTKYVSGLLSTRLKKDENFIKKTAVVLGDESLLNPLLNSIPEDLKGVNITMGYPLNKTPLASLFYQFMDLYIKKDSHGWFYKSVLAFLSHPYINILLDKETKNDAEIIIETIKAQNWAYIDIDKIRSLATSEQLSILFSEEIPNPEKFVKKCLAIILDLKDKLQVSNNALSLEYLYHFYTLFNQLLDVVQQHSFIDDLKSLQSIYKELLSSETLDFKGEPLQGLQIMGMLESRNLDFETVILTSVNEGILPSGKSNNSFIPFDLKSAFGLPTYKEKDAVYTYHFYRLLQRAKNIYLLYNTEPDVLEGGERSRLISQLLTDQNMMGKISQTIIAPAISPTIKTMERIDKDAALIELIEKYASKGFSPTSLSNYIRNPISFYKKNLLGIEDLSEVEETVAANTLGTIVHDTLEEIYKPFIGHVLTVDLLIQGKSLIRTIVESHFLNSYKGGDISYGKNLIAFNVVVRYIENFIDLEIADVKRHQIKIIGLEESYQINLDMPQLNFPVVLKGKLDRIDEKDGTLRIIDYKTGKVENKNVTIVDWQEIRTEYDQSKAFQLLCYATMYAKTNPFNHIVAGIISFKNLGSGLQYFGTKDSKASRKTDTVITQDTMLAFGEQLEELILEICNPDIPFVEKEV
ncbi:PD-(D/E)XK nuclease family protein [Kriegella aquimaris]|nr:PD-(D/E)XK nuclease family protein [Kriegella aquimaris]